MRLSRVSRAVGFVALLALFLAGCSPVSAAKPTIVVGAIYPLSGTQAEGGADELAGVRAALDVARQQGVPHADQVTLRVIDVPSDDAAKAAVDRLADDGVQIIMGTYGSTLSVVAAAEADRRHVVFWETGAIADQVTDHRHYVFRTVATGSMLGQQTAAFTSTVLFPRDHLQPASARVVMLYADDVYGQSVSAGARAEAQREGISHLITIAYNPNTVNAGDLAEQVKTAHPDYVWAISYLNDGISILQALAAHHVHVRAVVGKCSAFAMPELGQRLGSQAAGLFASDKPDGGIAPNPLSAAAKSLLVQAKAAYHKEISAPMDIPGMAGFVGGWTLFTQVLAHTGGASAETIRATAETVDVPVGDEINGGGVKFAPPGAPDAGQNLRAAAVVYQWQPASTGGAVVKHVVYPDNYATAPMISGAWPPQ